MKKILAAGLILVVALGLLVTGCTGTSLPGGPAIEMISATVETGTATMTGGTTTTTTSGTLPTTTTMTGTGTATATGSLSAMSVVIDVMASNFDVVSSVGQTDGDGYLVYYMDEFPSGFNEDVPGIGTTPTTPEMGNIYATTETSYNWNDVSAGIHLFAVQLVDTSGNPLSAPVVAAVVIIVPKLSSTATTTTTSSSMTTVTTTTPAPTTSTP